MQIDCANMVLKSVSLGNIIDAYSKAAGKGKLEELQMMKKR
jgi:hypothetical protein